MISGVGPELARNSVVLFKRADLDKLLKKAAKPVKPR
jgi:hypothetical protein